MFRSAPTVDEAPLLPSTDPRIDFTIKSLRALASLRAESEILVEHARGLGFEHPQIVAASRVIVGKRAAIYRAAREVDKKLPSPSPTLPLDVSLRAFYDDDVFSARRWPARLDTFIDTPTDVVAITERGMHVLVEARVAAVYGMLDAAMAIVDLNLRFDNPERRDQIEKRFRHLHARALLLMFHRASEPNVAPTEPAPPSTDAVSASTEGAASAAPSDVVAPTADVSQSEFIDTQGDAARVAGDSHGQQEERIEEARGEEALQDDSGADAGADPASSGEPRPSHSSGSSAEPERVNGATRGDSGVARIIAQ